MSYSGADKILFGEGILRDDVRLIASGENIIVDVVGTDDQITLEKFLSSDSQRYGFSVKAVEFADGEILDLSGRFPLEGTGAADNILGTSSDDTMDGLGGNDTLKAGSGNDAMAGGLGDDSLSGQDGDDVLQGGEGADSLQGDKGDDIYLFSLGDGQDIVFGENGLYSDEKYGTDKIVFGIGWWKT